MKRIEVKPLNAEGDIARTLMAHYHKEGLRNFLTSIRDGIMDGHTAVGVMEIYEERSETER